MVSLNLTFVKDSLWLVCYYSHMKLLNSFLMMTALALLSGCATGPIPQSINEKPLTRIAAIDATGLFAANWDARTLALVQSGLSLVDLNSKEKQKLSSDSPVALAFSPDSSVLAAAFPTAKNETRLTQYSSQGQLLHETILPIALTQLVWSARGDLLVTGYVLKKYSFGGDLQQLLYRVNGAEVTETVLSGTTLKLATVKLTAAIMAKVQPVAFSQTGDELVFVHLHDPPQFPPYLELVYYSWQVGKSRSLQKLPLQKLALDWGKTQSVTVQSSVGALTFALWPTAEETESLPSTKVYRFDTGRLYAGEELLADWGKDAKLQRLSGGRFLLSSRKALYLGDGLRPELSEPYSEKQWTLRRWRFQGLITSEEYQKLLREENP